MSPANISHDNILDGSCSMLRIIRCSGRQPRIVESRLDIYRTVSLDRGARRKTRVCTVLADATGVQTYNL